MSDPMDVFSDGQPRVFSIAEARKRIETSVDYLPLLGMDGYIVKGWTHLFAGWWRLGKTEMLAAVMLPWLRTGQRVLWITEEPDSLWADRADMVDELYESVPWDRLTLVDALSAPPEALLEYAANADADVIVADTIREVCGVQKMKDDDAVRAAVSPWLRRLRDGQRTLIFIAQHRKAAGEHGERVEGSVALPSMMDVVLELERVDGHERRRRLTVQRRRRATAPLIYEMDEDDRIIVVPDARSRTRVEVEAAVLTEVNASSEPLTTAEVRRRMSPKPSADTVLRALIAVAKEGRIVRDPPITEDAWRRTVRWMRGPSATASTAETPLPIGRDRAVDDAAVDSTVITRTMPAGMRHSACPKCGAIATVVTAARDALCARCMPLTPLRAYRADWMSQ
jgi:DNA repair protein RadA/Sms